MYHKANLNRIMADYTGQPVEQVRGSLGLQAGLGGAVQPTQQLQGRRSRAMRLGCLPRALLLRLTLPPAPAPRARRLRRTRTATATCPRWRPRHTA